MNLLKSMAKVAGAALVLFALNGLINWALMPPLGGATDPLDKLRFRLDDAAFVLLFVFIAVVYFAMFAVLPRERGYLYLGVISLLTSLQLFWDWDSKSLLFGSFPDMPHGSLAIKGGITFLSFSFVAYLIRTSDRPVTRGILWAGGLLWGVELIAVIGSANAPVFLVLNLLFLVHVFLGTAVSMTQFFRLYLRRRQDAELRLMMFGFTLFVVVLLPDPAKDLLEELVGHPLGYLRAYWEQCLEDTFSWALLALLTTYGVLFFRRFVETLKDNKTVSAQLRSKNAALEQEVDTRQRLDQLLSVLLRTYRVFDLEQSVIREGRRLFQPHAFALVKSDESTGSVAVEGSDALPAVEAEVRKLLQGRAGKRMSHGEEIAAPSIVLGSAGGTDKIRLYLAVYSTDGGPIGVEERDKFALLLLCKYVSIFYEYFQLLEGRMKELEQKRAESSPWLSKLFMQIAEKERRRLASDLHDEVLQELLHIRRTVERLSADPRMGGEMEPIRLGLDNAEFMIRETCLELMPSFLTERGVLHAISRLVEKTRLRADFQLDFRALPILSNLSDEQTTTVYRVVQELINNAVKHSNANRVTLEIGEQEGALNIRYTDDGKGLDPEVDFSAMNRFGLIGISERIRMVGGNVSVQSEPGLGVEIQCSVPV